MKNEANTQNIVRLTAANLGTVLWRNNVGAGVLDNGSFVRWGLANDTAAVNERIKSADLIGIRPVLVTQQMVGTIIGQFVSRECKAEGWRYRGTKREIAQKAWADLIIGYGGDATFTTGEYP